MEACLTSSIFPLWPIYYQVYQIQRFSWIFSGLWFHISALCGISSIKSRWAPATKFEKPSSVSHSCPQPWWVCRFLQNYDLGRHTVRVVFHFSLGSVKALYSPSGLTGLLWSIGSPWWVRQLHFLSLWISPGSYLILRCAWRMSLFSL